MSLQHKERTRLTPDLVDKVAKLKRKARRYLIKTEIVQFRLDEESYRTLLSTAQKQHKPVGTLVREWVTTMLKQENALADNAQQKKNREEIRQMIKQEIKNFLGKRKF